jgi:hypothetical protein
VLALWGARTHDIYLNCETYWSNVPEAVWEYTIGGDQVLKKWLSYREKDVLGREITKDEAREFTHIVRRIAALFLLEPKLDPNYAAIKANSHGWNAVPDVKSRRKLDSLFVHLRGRIAGTRSCKLVPRNLSYSH